MAAATAARNTKSRKLGEKTEYLMASSTTIHKGTMVAINASGLAISAASSDQNHGVVGVATKSVVGTGATDWIEVQEGEFNLGGSSLTQAMVGTTLYAVDNQTIGAAATDLPTAGRLVEYVSATEGWVRISADNFAVDAA